MEMPMDNLEVKPETYGLPENWTAGMMGMMTLVRVLPDDRYDEILNMKKNANARPTQKPAMEHHRE